MKSNFTNRLNKITLPVVTTLIFTAQLSAQTNTQTNTRTNSSVSYATHGAIAGTSLSGAYYLIQYDKDLSQFKNRYLDQQRRLREQLSSIEGLPAKPIGSIGSETIVDLNRLEVVLDTKGDSKFTERLVNALVDEIEKIKAKLKTENDPRSILRMRKQIEALTSASVSVIGHEEGSRFITLELPVVDTNMRLGGSAVVNRQTIVSILQDDFTLSREIFASITDFKLQHFSEEDIGKIASLKAQLADIEPKTLVRNTYFKEQTELLGKIKRRTLAGVLTGAIAGGLLGGAIDHANDINPNNDAELD